MGCGLVKKLKKPKISKPIHQNSIVLAHSFIRCTTETLDEKFKTQKILAQDLYSQIFLCTQSSTNQKFILKVIKKKSLPSFMLDDEKKIQEVEILRTLDHPCIIKCFEIFEEALETKLVLEYIQGGSLLEFRKERVSPFSENKLASITVQILLALRYIHERGIVHRNLSLESVFVNVYSNLQIKLGNFSHSSYTPASFCPGASPIYQAPEAFTNHFTDKSDMWSFGILFFILTTGKMPYATKKTDLIRAVKYSPFNSDIKEIQNLPKTLSEFLNGLLTKDPHQRFSAAQALHHNWLKKYIPAGALADHIITNFVTSKKNALQKSILVYICTHLLENKTVNELSKYFKQIDKDKNGIIDRKELIQAVQLKYSEAQAEVIAQKFFNNFDMNHNGVIDYTEFLTGICGQVLTDEHLDKVFKAIEKADFDRVTLSELSDFSGVPLSELSLLCSSDPLTLSTFKDLF